MLVKRRERKMENRKIEKGIRTGLAEVDVYAGRCRGDAPRSYL
jgi:hypothetical protein